MDKKFDLTGFDKITLDEMGGIRLMKRIDIKYLLSVSQLRELLVRLSEYYYVQDVDGERFSPYATLYFDTPEYEMYHIHQNGKLNRLKIRTREYKSVSLCYLEIKTKSNKGVTKKIRIKNGDLSHIDGEQPSSFIHQNSPYKITAIEGKLQNSYTRITLVDKQKTERVTIDLDLRFNNLQTERKAYLPELVIIEVKKSAYSSSPALRILSALRIKPARMSKYCMGVALTDEAVKHNKIKEKIKLINKITPINYESV